MTDTHQSFHECIFLVEDDPVISLDTADTLQDLGFDVVLLAACSADAIARIAGAPDLRAVVLDLDLKGEDAAPVAAAAGAAGVPVVVASGHSESVHETPLAAAQRIVKPYSPPELREALERALADGLSKAAG